MRLPLLFFILLLIGVGFTPGHAAEGVTVNYEHKYTYSGRKEYRTRNGGGTYVDNSTFYRYDHYATRLDQQTAITITVNPGASYNAATASYYANTSITRHR
ncbi:MAG: hypothetical protein J6333_05165, partial [Planctomycetes bacterium]|nr:hypothetical protein [Planctomycetota bacterium]